MCYVRLKNLRYVSFILLIFYCHFMKFCCTQQNTSLTDSQEIKNIFHSAHEKKIVPKDAHNFGNFAEGGTININTTSTRNNNDEKSLINASNKTLANDNRNIPVTETQNAYTYNDTPQNKKNSSKDSVDPLAKLAIQNETTTNLFLGVPEVFHVNGTSSIKARKGVYFNKIVPHKEIENEIEVNDTLLSTHSCIGIRNNICFDTSQNLDAECQCCKEDNLLGKIIKKHLVNCSTCKQIKLILKENSNPCQNICCKNNLFLWDSTTKITTEYVDGKKLINENPTNILVNKHNESEPLQFKLDYIKTNSSKKITTEEKLFVNSTKKFKPHITKVPCDVEIVSELSSKYKKKFFLPFLISIFVVPLIGVPLFLLYRRAKEYWEKRYYERMDFLIDGIYNA